MKNKNGFTLIELLAVILILGIIALIAIPTVNKILKEAKRGAFDSSMQNIIKAAEEKCMMENMKGNSIKQFIFNDGKVTPSLDIKGELPKSGMITLDDNCKATGILANNDFKYVLEDKKSRIEDCNGNSCAYGLNLVSADEKYICYNFKKETGTIIKYDGSNPVCQGDVTIPAMIDGTPVTAINPLAFVNPDQIYCESTGGEYTPVDSSYIPALDDGCKALDFTNNYSYNKIDMSNAGFLTNIGYQAFSNANIKEVIFNDNTQIIGEKAFMSNATSKIVLPKNLTNLGKSAFYISQIEELVINNKLENIPEHAFLRNSIKAINIPKGVKSIGYGAFAYGDYENNQTIVNISDTVITIDDEAFVYSGIKEVNFGKNVESIGAISFSDNHLKSIKLPNSLKQMGGGAFAANDMVDTPFIYNLNNDKTENKKSLNSLAYRQSNVVVPNGVEELDTFALGYCGITNITLPEGLKYIGESVLEGNDIESVTIPSTVEFIGRNALNKGYSGNANLTSIINKTGRSFVWGRIAGLYVDDFNFETGTITHSYGNITVSK